MTNYIYGDVLNQKRSKVKYLTHVCNDIGMWGAGFTKSLSLKWKIPEIAYRKYIQENKPGIHNLGKNIICEIEKKYFCS